MLVLTRRPGESIVIGNGIKLTVVNIGPGRVKIGIEAPPSVRVDRAEIHARIQHEKATDVLEAVSAHAAENSADQPTLIAAGPDTDVLTNRVGDQLPAVVPAAPAPVAKPAGFRPRKPR
jgi:carbon storage regulator